MENRVHQVQVRYAIPPVSEFVDTFLNPGVPVVFKNVLDANSLWSLQFLVDLVGHREVHVRKNTNIEQYKVLFECRAWMN
jgi:hypothetical protein